MNRPDASEVRCECGHVESEHRSIPPYYCQKMMTTNEVCGCKTFIEENKDRLDAEYEAQRLEDQQEKYR